MIRPPARCACVEEQTPAGEGRHLVDQDDRKATGFDHEVTLDGGVGGTWLHCAARSGPGV